MIKAIETEYNGYKFRSRLEARWAVFFDALGVKYEYEPEGYRLPNGEQYLPDFRVKCWGKRGEIRNTPFDLFIEVKGHMTQDDARKIRIFANIHDFHNEAEYEAAMKEANPILIVSDIPSEHCSFSALELGAYDSMDDTSVYPYNYELIDGDYFGAFPAAFEGKFFLWGDDSNYIWNEVEVENAYKKARQARFEHGETPNIRRF